MYCQFYPAPTPNCTAKFIPLVLETSTCSIQKKSVRTFSTNSNRAYRHYLKVSVDKYVKLRANILLSCNIVKCTSALFTLVKDLRLTDCLSLENSSTTRNPIFPSQIRSQSKNYHPQHKSTNFSSYFSLCYTSRIRHCLLNFQIFQYDLIFVKKAPSQEQCN